MKVCFFFVTLVFFAGCRPSMPAHDDPLIGTWLVKTGGVPLMAVTLQRKEGAFSGSLSWPEKWTSDGVTFTKVGPRAVTRPIASAVLKGAVLHFSIVNPKDPTDIDEFEVTLIDANHGTLKYVGLPYDPWPLTKNTSNDRAVMPGPWDPRRSYSLDLPAVTPSAAMAAIFEEDQAARQNPNMSESQWVAVAEQDATRRKRTRALLDAKELHAGQDFREAAFVFQHGNGPDDFLVAHTLALVALAKGDIESRWIAAASLDRYLSTIHQPQIYGTGFDTHAVALEPYNRSLISDDLRQALGVPPIAEQQDQMKSILKLQSK